MCKSWWVHVNCVQFFHLSESQSGLSLKTHVHLFNPTYFFMFITHEDLYIHMNLEILSLCTETWTDTSGMNKAWYRCHVRPLNHRSPLSNTFKKKSALLNIVNTDGIWSLKHFLSIDCGLAPNITNGHIRANGTTYGAIGSVICDQGYNASVSSVTCMINGTWSSTSCMPLGICLYNKSFVIKKKVAVKWKWICEIFHNK